MNLDIERIFSYHPPKSDQVALTHDRVRKAIRGVAEEIDLLVPVSPEKTLAIRKLQEAMMYANSAIAQYME